MQEVGAAAPGRFRPMPCKQIHCIVEKAIAAAARIALFQNFDAMLPIIQQSMMALACRATKCLASFLWQTRAKDSTRFGQRHLSFPAEARMRYIQDDSWQPFQFTSCRHGLT
jgi:hypothetical protein